MYEECNGCFQPLGSKYCLVCEKNFCQECDVQAHILPAYSKHERVPLSQMAHFKIVCVHHKLPLKYYCESCSDPVCTECFEKGSHSNKLHKITNVIDSFRKKYSFLQNLVNHHLNQKTEQLVDQIQNIENTSDQVRNNKLEIEREIKREYVKILENLK
jgi:palmitoyltransferase